jgi:outer membrane protein assembly factor BamA
MAFALHFAKAMARLVALVLWLCIARAAESPRPVEDVVVLRNRAISKDSIIKISGLDQDRTLSTAEITRRLLATSLFSEVSVSRTGGTIRIIVREKTRWFALPYLFFVLNANVFGVAAGESSVLGEDDDILARYQFGSDDREASLLVRDEYFLRSRWALGVSFDFENSLHRIYDQREVIERTVNEFYGGSQQTGYHLNPHATLLLNTYIEWHRFEEPAGDYHQGLQISHRLGLVLGDFTQNEGFAQGIEGRLYFEGTNPASDFHFRKFGSSAELSLVRRGNMNLITRPRFENGNGLPRYQLFELGAARLRSFEYQEFRDRAYVEVQNDLLVASYEVWAFRLRPLVYTDWAFIQGSGRTGFGVGFQAYVRHVVIPAVQVYAGYGFNPWGFSIAAAIGPQL